MYIIYVTIEKQKNKRNGTHYYLANCMLNTINGIHYLRQYITLPQATLINILLICHVYYLFVIDHNS